MPCHSALKVQLQLQCSAAAYQQHTRTPAHQHLLITPRNTLPISFHQTQAYAPATQPVGTMTSKTLSILCFGDSLTSGWHSFGMESHPYSIAFAARVQESLPDTKLEVHTSGVAGDVATFQRFQQRLEVECECNICTVLFLGSVGTSRKDSFSST